MVVWRSQLVNAPHPDELSNLTRAAGGQKRFVFENAFVLESLTQSVLLRLTASSSITHLLRMLVTDRRATLPFGFSAKPDEAGLLNKNFARY